MIYRSNVPILHWQPAATTNYLFRIPNHSIDCNEHNAVDPFIAVNISLIELRTRSTLLHCWIWKISRVSMDLKNNRLSLPPASPQSSFFGIRRTTSSFHMHAYNANVITTTWIALKQWTTCSEFHFIILSKRPIRKPHTIQVEVEICCSEKSTPAAATHSLTHSTALSRIVKYDLPNDVNRRKTDI